MSRCSRVRDKQSTVVRARPKRVQALVGFDNGAPPVKDARERVQELGIPCRRSLKSVGR